MDFLCFLSPTINVKELKGTQNADLSQLEGALAF